ncbi:hypothetical protein RvY_14280 [Ramazzottius varieornatus]|uniref:Major facilitator superfamily (MFS) profile domain-containing protein n=1 Tax=Ramazzottius varieornatus TaxID=947166 RepID=A0A1D1VSQ1_RAMVA|nr:hypothetical protein RvY_14280 [Ramazzottius varieornatus]
MEFDDILLDVGDYSRYQLLVLFCFCLPMCIFSGLHAFIQLFLSAPPQDYWCTVSPLSTLNKSTMLLLAIPRLNASPKDEDSLDLPHDFSRCHMYARNYSSYHSLNPTTLNVFLMSDNDPNQIIPCQHGWTYEASIHSTIVEWDLVCTRDTYSTLALFIFTLGSVTGLMCFGAMSDYLGRKPAMFACLAVQIIFGTLSGLAPTFALWCVARFFVGFTIPSALRIPMIFAIELVRPEKRTRVGIMTTAFYSIGTILLAGLAYLLPHWRPLSLAVALPETVLLFLWHFVPESPRWLLANNRSVEIKSFLQYAARVNGRFLGSNTMSNMDLILDHHNRRETPSYGIADLFRLPNMRRKTLLITLIWFSNISVYMGLSYYAPTLGSGTIYLKYFLSMLIEIPAYPLVWSLTEALGRRLPLCCLMLVGGMLCVVTVLLPTYSTNIILSMYLLGKFAISGSFFVLSIHAGELYPTVVRGIGLGTSATIATLGVCLAPLIIHLGKDYMTLPLAIFGVFAILGGFCALFLPETWHQKLPETLQEGEEFGKAMSVMDDLRLKDELRETAKELAKVRMLAAGEKTEVFGALNIEKEDEDLVFDQHEHFRTFPQPANTKRLSVTRLNNGRGFMTDHDSSR